VEHPIAILGVPQVKPFATGVCAVILCGASTAAGNPYGFSTRSRRRRGWLLPANASDRHQAAI